MKWRTALQQLFSAGFVEEYEIPPVQVSIEMSFRAIASNREGRPRPQNAKIKMIHRFEIHLSPLLTLTKNETKFKYKVNE